MTGCWNGSAYQAFSKPELVTAISYDGSSWEAIECTPSEHPDCGTEFSIEVKNNVVQIAHLVPYTDSMLQKTLRELEPAQDVQIYNLGSTVEGRPLEMVEIGNPDAKHQFLIRARAHPWESGGSWVLEGLMRYLTVEADDEAKQIKERVCFCIMPISNKDGVYRGMTRFNVRGVDLNRGWLLDPPIDPVQVPENACLYNWLCQRKNTGKLPGLAIGLHNDSSGPLIFANSKDQGYRDRMKVFENLMRENSWFTEKVTGLDSSNFGSSFAQGLHNIFGIDAMIYELKVLPVDGLGGRPALHTDWMDQGKNLAKVVDKYFSITERG